MSETIIKVLRPSIDGKDCYNRIPIAKKIIGTGGKDSEILINAGIPDSMMDIAFNLETGAYSLDNTLGRSSIVGVVVNMESGDPVEEFHGHPVTVLVKLIEFAAKE